VDNVTWRDPPEAPGGRRVTPAYEGEARALRLHPGDWKVIDSFPAAQASAARNLAVSVRTGRLQVFRPPGAFEAVSRTEEEHDERGHLVKVVNVYARFTGS
jgi:hypothetical protein